MARLDCKVLRSFNACLYVLSSGLLVAAELYDVMLEERRGHCVVVNRENGHIAVTIARRSKAGRLRNVDIEIHAFLKIGEGKWGRNVELMPYV